MVLLLLSVDKYTGRTDTEKEFFYKVQNISNMGLYQNKELEGLRGWLDIGTGTNYREVNQYQREGPDTKVQRTNTIWISNKIMNKLVKSKNGNRNDRTNLNIIHWNGGARKWENKLEEIESLVREKNPDLCYISEANLWTGLDPLNMNIPGYNLHLPNTMDSLQHSRMVLLSKEDLIVKEIVDKTEKELAMIWVQVGGSRKNSILIGGMYRQHKLLGLDRIMTGMELIQEQEKKMEQIYKKNGKTWPGTEIVLL